MSSKYLEKARQVRARQDVHFNCAQGVLVPFARALGLDEETAFRVGANFGSGMRMGATCGAVTGALMVLGLAGVSDRADCAAFLRKVRGRHEGCLDCRDLLKKNLEAGNPQKDHCDGMVYELVELTEDLLREKGKIE